MPRPNPERRRRLLVPQLALACPSTTATLFLWQAPTPFLFNGMMITERVAYWPRAFLLRSAAREERDADHIVTPRLKRGETSPQTLRERVP
jgi:hypothetical protein